jgi:hypothetical protein
MTFLDSLFSLFCVDLFLVMKPIVGNLLLMKQLLNPYITF